MITEDFVSFETAKLLKEKGFDAPCFAYYYVMPHKTVIAYDTNFPKNSDLCLMYANMEFGSLPTLQMAMKWLREKHNLFIQITVDFSDGAYPMYDACVVDLARCTSIIVIGYDRYYYTQACETAIKYCLENLI